MIITADPRLHGARRPGYSLIELLVTLAIILIISAMVSAAAVQVMAYQRGSITQTTLKVLNDSLDRQWRAVVDSARREARSISQDTHPAFTILPAGEVRTRPWSIRTSISAPRSFT